MPLASACALALAGPVVLGWLPVVGLGRLLAAVGPAAGAAGGSPGLAIGGIVQRTLEPPVPEVLAHSLVLGIEVGVGVLILAWLLRPEPGAGTRRRSPRDSSAASP